MTSDPEGPSPTASCKGVLPLLKQRKIVEIKAIYTHTSQNLTSVCFSL